MVRSCPSHDHLRDRNHTNPIPLSEDCPSTWIEEKDEGGDREEEKRDRDEEGKRIVVRY